MNGVLTSPRPVGAINLAQDHVQPLCFPRLMLPGWQLHDFAFKVAAPAGLEVMGSSGLCHMFVDRLPVHRATELGPRDSGRLCPGDRQLWPGFFSRIDDPNMRGAVADTVRQAACL